MWQSRADTCIRDDEHAQDQECANSHCPAEADLGQEVLHHQGEDDASERRACYTEAGGDTAAFAEVCLWLYIS